MRRNIGRGVLAITLAFAAVWALAAAAGSASAGNTLRIRIPKAIDPEQVTVRTGDYGNGLAVDMVRAEKGVYEYSHDLSANLKSLKILMFAPGYRMVTAEFAGDDLALNKVFAPRFEKLPAVPATIRFVDTSGKPIPGRDVEIKQSLKDPEFFGYCDGPFTTKTVVEGTTDAAGEIHVSLPVLPEDPYYANPADQTTGFWINITPPEGTPKEYGWFPTPWLVPAQRKYDKPVVITMTYHGDISAQFSKAFLADNGVPDEALQPNPQNGGATRVTLMAESPGSTHIHRMSSFPPALRRAFPTCEWG